jgi:hypothetical protein
VPFALVILLTPLLISESFVPKRVRLDLLGAVTVTGGLLAVIYAVIEKRVPVAVAGVLLLAAILADRAACARPAAHPSADHREVGQLRGVRDLAMEPAMIFLTTLYLQKVLGFSPLTTGLVFSVPGLASVAAGVIAGRVVGRFDSRAVLVAGMTTQALATLPLVFLGADRAALLILIPALFIGFFGHVTATTGLTSMTQ